MKSNELPNISEIDDILLVVEQFKMGLIARATGGDFKDSEYTRFRKIVMNIPGIENLIPRFLKLCRNPDEFWAYISGEASTYKDRRLIIGEAINPILEFLEHENSEGALEFNKNYLEIKTIGQGGFGLVYLYEHKLLKLPFAVKVFAPAFYEGGEKELERFFQEARMLFKLQHQAIIKVYDAGLMGQRPFIRMEYFEGQNLNQALIKHGTINSKKALTLIKAITEGLEHAHEKVGIIHRDLKPSNIMVAKPNIFKIIDFGLGVFIENELHSRITKTGENIIGGYYNAPELIQNPKLVDKRSDIYSIGAIWFTILTGQPPAGTTIIDQLNDLNLTPDYINCINKCLASVKNRYENCTILLEEITKLEKQ